MKDHLPLRASGFDAEARHQQSLHDRAYGANRINRSSTVRAKFSTAGGICLEAFSRGGGAGVVVRPYLITALYNADYFGAKLYDPGTQAVSGAEVLIAKCISGRLIATETLDGIPFDYDYDTAPTKADNFRVQLQSDAVYEYHVMHPRYRKFDPVHPIDELNPAEQYLVYAAKISRGSGVLDDHDGMIKLCELAPVRFWTYQYDQSGPPS